MKTLQSLLATSLLLVIVFLNSCSKNESTSPPEISVKDSVLLLEQNAAEQFGIGYSLVNEIIYMTIRQAMLTPELHGLSGEDRVEDRAACPNTTFLPDMGGGDTLVIDFGTGCTIPNGSGNGPTVSGQVLLISIGALNTNENQFIQFDTITINGYKVIHLAGPSSSGLKFNNVTPSPSAPFNYLFEARASDLTSFVIEDSDGDISSIAPTYTPFPFLKLEVVDNDPPLMLDFLDFLDAHFEIDIEPMTVSTYRADGSVDFFRVTKVFGEPLIYNPPCRWFDDGQLSFTGTINQILDFGYDLDGSGNGVPGTGCDGVLKVSAGGVCTIVQCP